MAADTNNYKSQYNYAQMLLKGDVIPQNLPQGADYLNRSFENGKEEAIYEYGILLEEALGIPADPIKALIYYEDMLILAI